MSSNFVWFSKEKTPSPCELFVYFCVHISCLPYWWSGIFQLLNLRQSDLNLVPTEQEYLNRDSSCRESTFNREYHREGTTILTNSVVPSRCMMGAKFYSKIHYKKRIFVYWAFSPAFDFKVSKKCRQGDLEIETQTKELILRNMWSWSLDFFLYSPVFPYYCKHFWVTFNVICTLSCTFCK